jgi:hypothetical protein
VFPLKDISTSSCLLAFTAGWISRFGVPDDITSDRGTQFTAGVWTDFCKRLGIKHHLTTAYHPQANGLVERFHRQLKEALRARAAGDKWMDSLPWVLLGLRSAPKEDSGLSSAELVYGAPLSLPGEFLGSPDMSVETLVDRARTGLPSFEPPATRPCHPEAGKNLPAALASASHVYVLRGGSLPPLAPRYSGPFVVLERSAKTFRLAVGNREEVVSVDRLKPHLGTSPTSPAVPPRRGRPPSGILSYAEVVVRGRGRPQSSSASTSTDEEAGGE